MGSDSELNDVVDQLIENVESAISKLSNSLDLKNEDARKQNEIPRILPHPSVYFPSPLTCIDPTIQTKSIYTKISLEEKIIEEESNKSKPIPEIENTTFKPKPIQKTKKEDEKARELTSHRKTETTQKVKRFEKQPTIKEENELAEDYEFIDISASTKIIHLYGPPSSGKTSLALQAAVEISPLKTYYIMTSHSTSTMNRIKQMLNSRRWSEIRDFKHNFYPLVVENHTEIIENLVKIESIYSEDVKLIVIDHITDYFRGDLNKEEIKNKIREIIEKLCLLADNKNCKIILINGYSYQNTAPAADLIESFSDVTIHAKKETDKLVLQIHDENIDYFIDDSGIRNVCLNFYYH